MKYKIDVLKALKDAGYSSYRLRKEKILGESVIQHIRDNKVVSYANIEVICTLLGCDIGDIMTVDE